MMKLILTGLFLFFGGGSEMITHEYIINNNAQSKLVLNLENLENLVDAISEDKLIPIPAHQSFGFQVILTDDVQELKDEKYYTEEMILHRCKNHPLLASENTVKLTSSHITDGQIQNNEAIIGIPQRMDEFREDGYLVQSTSEKIYIRTDRHVGLAAPTEIEFNELQG